MPTTKKRKTKPRKRPIKKRPTKKKGTTKKRGRPRSTNVSPYKRCYRKKVGRDMALYKRGKLRYAQSQKNPKGVRVTNRKQAIAISLNVAQRYCKGKKK